MSALSRRSLHNYAFALATATAAVALLGLPGMTVAFSTLIFFFATLFAAWWGGFRPGLLAVVAIIGSKVGSLDDLSGWIRCGLFLLEGVAICALVEGLHAARRRAEEQAEAALESGRRFRLLFDLSPHAMWVHDVRSAQFLEVNEEATRLYGYTADEFRRMTVGDLLPTQDLTPRPAEDASCPGRADASPVFDRVWRHRTRDGRLIEVETRSSAVGLGGRPARLVLASDVTERRRTQGELVAAREAAETANRAKDQFLATLSHELRAPLTPVLAEATARLAEPDTAPGLRPVFEMIRRNVELEARLIDDLFDVARIDRGMLRLQTEVVDVHAILERALEVCEGDLRAGRFRVDRRLTARHPHVLGDPARLQQVFWNLVKNAAKFTPPGGWIGIRTADLEGPGGRLVIEVADDGAGIDPGFVPKVFEPFAQEDPGDRRRVGGLGLGLAICRSVVEAHGGRIAVRSAGVGLGSTFTVELACSAAPRTEEVHDPAAPIGAGDRAVLEILFVEDHADSLRTLASLLRRSGHGVATAASCTEALDVFGAGEFDLVISDLGLPDGSGLELLPRLLAMRPVPAIALSGHGGEAEVSRSRQAGFGVHLTKPVDYSALERAGQRLVKDWRDRRCVMPNRARISAPEPLHGVR